MNVMKSAGVLVAAGLFLGGCSALPVVSGVPAPTPEAPVTVTVTAPAPSPTVTTTVASAGASAAPSIISVAPGTDRTLHLTDAYSVESAWSEAGFQPVGSAETRQAIGARVYCVRGPQLEFRFAQNGGTFKATVAQDMNSALSTQELEWSLVVDGRLAETKRIAFKDSAEFTTPLSGVAVVQLNVAQAKPCKESVIALVTSAVIQG